jgi:hypothetical protein
MQDPHSNIAVYYFTNCKQQANEQRLPDHYGFSLFRLTPQNTAELEQREACAIRHK